MKFTKIVCTIGPASEKSAILKKMIDAGMNVARLNFSHGTHPSHAQLIKNIRAAAKICKQPIAILQDLQGPRIRIGEVSEKGVQLTKGESVVMVGQSEYREKSAEKMLPNQFPGLAKAVQPGGRILIADGLIDLRVVRVSGLAIHCTVIAPGVVKSHKGINAPGAHITISGITKKDEEDLAFGVAQGVDYVALSFVSSAKDILHLRALLKRLRKVNQHADSVKIIAKIEREEAIHNFKEILEVVDGIMVARGDLGIEIPAERVPLLQKEMIAKCMHAKKPVIVATQMLESMIASRRPTRAEVSDVANAVIDHTDAVMLSGESATGLYPLETVMLMARTIHETEKSKFDDYRCTHVVQERTTTEMIAHAVCDIVLSKKIRAIVITQDVANELSPAIASHRPETPILTVSVDAQARQQLNLVRGVQAFAREKELAYFMKKHLRAKATDLFLMVHPRGLEITSRA